MLDMEIYCSMMYNRRMPIIHISGYGMGYGFYHGGGYGTGYRGNRFSGAGYGYGLSSMPDMYVFDITETEFMRLTLE